MRGVLLTSVALAARACSIEDGTAFGAPYTIASSPQPYISEGGEVVFTATYSSTCAGGGSTFEVSRFGEAAGENAPARSAEAKMPLAKRPRSKSCRTSLFLPMARSWRLD